MMQPFTYLPPQIDIHDAGLAAVLTNGLAANLLICAEDRRESLLALPEFAAVGAQIALGQKAPYSLVLHNTLQLLIFLPAHPARDHALYKQVRGWVAPLTGLKIERLGLHLEGFDETDTTLLAELVLATLLAANVPLPSHKHRSEDPGATSRFRCPPIACWIWRGSMPRRKATVWRAIWRCRRPPI